MTEVTTSVHRVVLVDDTDDVRMLLRVLLEIEGDFQIVAEAGNGVRGIAVVRESQPDLVLLDLAMPVMDGLEALPLILQACPTTKVVVLSGFDRSRVEEQALAAGASAYLQKGVRPEEIVAVARRVLDLPQSPPIAIPAQAHKSPDDEVDQLRTQLATAAHELRNQTTLLVGLSKTLHRSRHRLDDAKKDELLDAIQRQALVLDRVTANLLTSSQTHRGSVTADLQPVELLPAALAAALAVTDRVEVNIVIDPDILVVADEVLLQQMLVNLLSNAVKYGAPPLSVSATPAAPGGSTVQVTVEDHGPGVPVAFRERLFQEWSRAGGTSTPGSGLGLYVVSSLAQAQRGKVWWEPIDDAGGESTGSRFCFTLQSAADRRRDAG